MKLKIYKDIKMMSSTEYFSNWQLIMTRAVADRFIYFTLLEVREAYKRGGPFTYTKHWSGVWQLLDNVRDDFDRFLPEQLETYRQAKRKWPLQPVGKEDEDSSQWCIEDAYTNAEHQFRILIANKYSDWIKKNGFYAQVVKLKSTTMIYLSLLWEGEPFGIVMPMKPAQEEATL